MSNPDSTTPLQQAIDALLSPYTRPHDPADAEALRQAIAATGCPVGFDWVSIRAGQGTIKNTCDGQGYNMHEW